MEILGDIDYLIGASYSAILILNYYKIELVIKISLDCLAYRILLK